MTRECENIRERIEDYLEGTLSGELSEALNKHLEQCSDCREYFDTLVADDKLLSGFAQAMLPELNRLENAVMEKLDSTVAKPKVETYRLWNNIFRNKIVQISAAAVVLFVLGISIAVYFGTDSSLPVEINKQSFVKGQDSFKLDTDAQQQIAQIQSLIDANQVEILASVLDMPLAAKQSKLLAAQFLAGKNDMRGLSALEMLTSEDKTSDTYIQTASKVENAVSPTTGPGKISAAERSMLNAVDGEGKYTITSPVIDKTLDGKIAVVRVYDNWRSEPAKFRMVNVEIKNRAVNFDSIGIDANDVNEAQVVVVFCDDQKDPNVAEYMSECVYAGTYKKDLNFSIPTTAYKNRYIVFNDACIAGGLVIDDVRPQGKPVPQANVEVYLVSNDGKRIYICEYMTNVGGVLVVPHTRGELNHFDFVVSQPDYGIARVSNYTFSNSSVDQISLPLVSKDSEEAQRAVRGYVVDSVGRPVSGAEIYCAHIRTLGEGLIDSSESRIKVISGEDGRFRLYLLNTNRKNERGNMIPPKSRYSLRIDAPRKMGLIAFQDFVLNDNEYKIVLEKGDLFRRFAFYDENGLITEQQKLESLNIYVNPNKEGRLVFNYNDIKDGAMLPYGAYQAQMYYNGKEIYFEPIKVTSDTGQILVFKLPEKIEFYGKVLDGITDKPMANVIVFAMNGTRGKSLVELTDQEWDILHSVDFNQENIDYSLLPLNEFYDLKYIVRPDANGMFKMWFRTGEVYGIIAAEENYLPLMQRIMNVEVDENRRFEVPTFRLFPAAKVILKPVFNGEAAKSGSIWPNWVILKQGNPDWIQKLLDRDNGQDQFQYARWMDLNNQHQLFVPSGTSVTLRFHSSNDRLNSVYVEVSNLQQGQVLNIGEIEFLERFEIAIKVVDSQGNACEGIPVRYKMDNNLWSVAHNTDEKGRAFFYVDPNSINTFRISHYYEDGHIYSEMIEINTAAKEPAEKEFIFKISDELLNLLFQ